MNSLVDFRYLTTESRAQVYLIWAFITGIGYTGTHFYQNPNINFVWFVLSIIGLFYMYKVMPLRVKQMRNIFLSWLIPITVGLIVSVVAVRTDFFPELVGYLGAYWLLVSAVGYFWNGIFDSPSIWYYSASAINVVFAMVIYLYEPFLTGQYLLAGIVSVWSMLMLWIFRSDA